MHPTTRVDVRAYLEIRTAAPSGFSPDGRRLLISSDVPGTSQLYRLDRDQLDSRPLPPDRLTQLTDLAEPVGGGYLPTERRLLVAMDAGGNERHQLYLLDDEPAAPVTDPDALTPLVVDAEHIHRPGGVSRDGRWLAYATNRRTGADFDVWVRDLVDDTETCVWDAGGWASPAGFSPDGRHLAVSELTHRPGDNRLWLVDRDSGRRTELASHDDRGEAAVGAPSWLPEADVFFFSTDVDREFAGIARGTPDGAWEYVIEPGWDAACAVDWTGRHLLVVWNEHGVTRARLHDPATIAAVADVSLPGDGVAGGFAFSRDGRHLAYAYSSALVPGDAWLHDPATGTARRLTTSPCAVDTATFVAPESVAIPSFDGLEVPAFVYRPADRGAAPAPVVVYVHGGPESQFRPGFGPMVQYLAARGFAVIAPNVRGSTGYGKRYQHLDDVDRRLDSVADLAAIHDWLETQPDLDGSRAALYGGSYGGYMVLAGLAFQPDRWAAGVDIVGISNLVTFLENTSDWRRAFREREYGSLTDDRELLVAASPSTHVDAMRAPLLIIHGANDPRVPLGEAEQIHAVLTGKGVRSELLVYPDEGHGLARLANRIDAYPKVADFLDEVLR